MRSLVEGVLLMQGERRGAQYVRVDTHDAGE